LTGAGGGDRSVPLFWVLVVTLADHTQHRVKR
jgi:hypothetical protein